MLAPRAPRLWIRFGLHYQALHDKRHAFGALLYLTARHCGRAEPHYLALERIDADKLARPQVTRHRDHPRHGEWRAMAQRVDSRVTHGYPADAFKAFLYREHQPAQLVLVAGLLEALVCISKVVEPRKAIALVQVAHLRAPELHHSCPRRQDLAHVVDYLTYVRACLAEHAHEHQPVIVFKVIKFVDRPDPGHALDRRALGRPLEYLAGELVHDFLHSL